MHHVCGVGGHGKLFSSIYSFFIIIIIIIKGHNWPKTFFSFLVFYLLIYCGGALILSFWKDSVVLFWFRVLIIWVQQCLCFFRVVTQKHGCMTCVLFLETLRVLSCIFYLKLFEMVRVIFSYNIFGLNFN